MEHHSCNEGLVGLWLGSGDHGVKRRSKFVADTFRGLEPSAVANGVRDALQRPVVGSVRAASLSKPSKYMGTTSALPKRVCATT